jgi:integrase/recombinase XerD
MKRFKDKQFLISIKSFLTDYLPNVRGKSENTIKSYRDTINLLIRFFIEVKQIDIYSLSKSLISGNSIIDFLDWMINIRGCKATTRNQRLSCIRTFYRYLAVNDPSLISELNAIGEIANLNVEKDKAPVFLNEKQMTLVLSLPDIKTKLGIRDQTYLSLLYDSGARDNELRSLKLSDVLIAPNDGKLHLIGKGNKTRMTPVSKQVVRLLRKYLTIFHNTDLKSDNYFFYTVQAGIKSKMSADNSARIMNKYEIIAKNTFPNIPHLHPHLFRHSRAMHLYQAGMPLALVSEWLGHSQMETTLIYAHADTSMKRKAIENAMKGKELLFPKELPKYMDDEKIIRKLFGLA